MPPQHHTKFKIFCKEFVCNCNEELCISDLENIVNDWLVINDGNMIIQHYQLDIHKDDSIHGTSSIGHITISIFYKN